MQTSWKGLNDLTITTSSIDSEISFSETTIDIAATNPTTGFTNPDWVVGPRDYFRVNWSGSPGSSADDVTLNIEFAQPITSADKMIFLDFEAGEKLIIRAYDAGGSLIDGSNLALSYFDGNFEEASGYTVGDLSSSDPDISVPGESIHWRADADPGSEPGLTLVTNTDIHRLEYVLDMQDSSTSITGASVRFNFAHADPIPEPATALLVALGCGGMCLLRRRS